MTNFTKLKAWLKRNNIEFEKGFSMVDEDTEEHNFIIIPSVDLQIYNDESGLTLDDGNGFETYQDNKQLYHDIKEYLK